MSCMYPNINTICACNQTMTRAACQNRSVHAESHSIVTGPQSLTSGVTATAFTLVPKGGAGVTVH